MKDQKLENQVKNSHALKPPGSSTLSISLQFNFRNQRARAPELALLVPRAAKTYVLIQRPPVVRYQPNIIKYFFFYCPGLKFLKRKRIFSTIAPPFAKGGAIHE